MLKYCSICNEEMGDYGNKQLKDGVCCRDCVKLATPWLKEEDYKELTIETFRNHLFYRKENRMKLNDFKCDDFVEGKYSLYIDTKNKSFIFTKSPDPIIDNADIFELNKITDIRTKEEVYSNGTEGVDLYFEVQLKDSIINTIRFRLNEFGCIEANSEQYRECLKTAETYKEHLLNPISGKEIDMSERQGRKKHVVNGNVSEIKRSDKGLDTKPVGTKGDLLKALFSLVKPKKK